MREHTIHEVLGNCGFGVAYKERHNAVDHFAAIKEYRPAWSLTARVRRSAPIAGTARHNPATG